ncbi:MAG TPA: hypothetical protein VJJ83_02080 [Candidatus Babeliales bacterium]|nr:hypothetical protein [Candidatus Babeliales bacterium]
MSTWPSLCLTISPWQTAILDAPTVLTKSDWNLSVAPGFKQTNLTKRPPSFPYISGDTFRALADHVFDETVHELDFAQINASLIRTGDSVFVKTDYLKRFFTQLHPRITATYILITHNSDRANPGDYAHYLDDPKLGHWFGCNPDLPQPQPKFTGIPIGLANAYHGMHGEHGVMTAARRALQQKPKLHKRYLLGLNFAVLTNHTERGRVHALFNQKPYCKVFMDAKNRGRQSYKNYLKDLTRTQFVISPHGAGLDCHRTWEALLLGSVPVVQSSTLDGLYTDLPVIVVPKWSQVTRKLLRAQLAAHSTQNFKLERLFFPYWADLISTKQAEIRRS